MTLLRSLILLTYTVRALLSEAGTEEKNSKKIL